MQLFAARSYCDPDFFVRERGLLPLSYSLSRKEAIILVAQMKRMTTKLRLPSRFNAARQKRIGKGGNYISSDPLKINFSLDT